MAPIHRMHTSDHLTDGVLESEEARSRRQLQRLAHILDSAIPLPGGYRIGFDGFLGLIPGVGDLAGAAFSSYILAQAHRLGAPISVLLHMAANILLEMLVGILPVLGDLFDFVWKANQRNVELLEAHLGDPRRTRRRSTWVVAGIVTGVIVASALIAYLAIALIHWVWTSLSAA